MPTFSYEGRLFAFDVILVRHGSSITENIMFAKRPRSERQQDFLLTKHGNWGLLSAVRFDHNAPPWYIIKPWCRDNLEGFWLHSKADDSYFFQIPEEAEHFCETWNATLINNTQDH